MIFTNCIPHKNAKTNPKSMLVIKNMTYSIPSIHSHPPLRTLKAGQNDDLIQVLTSEMQLCLLASPVTLNRTTVHTHTFSSTVSLLLYNTLLHRVPLQEGQLFLRSPLLFPNIFVLLKGNRLDNNTPVCILFHFHFQSTPPGISAVPFLEVLHSML